MMYILVKMHPKPRDEWMKRQAFLLKRGHPTEGHVMLIGDSLVNNFFTSYINYGVGGDRISNVL